MTLSQLKQTAAEYGLEWSAVRAVYDSIRAADMTQHDRNVAFLDSAFTRLNGSNNAGHWKARYRKELNGGDYASIPGFDETADGLAAEYPDIISTDSACQDLWTMVSGPAPEPPTSESAADRTIERALEECPAAAGSPRDMVSTREAAALAGVSDKWIRRLAESGKIPARRVGRTWVVSAAAAARFQRHPTAGRPRLSAAEFSEVPF